MLNRLLAMRNRKKKGFTLIELIVVIAILAIIAALAIPAYNGLQTQSAQKIADANARTVYTAAKASIALGTGSETKVTQEQLKAILGDDFAGTSYGYEKGTATWSGPVNGSSDTTGKYVGTTPTPAT